MDSPLKQRLIGAAVLVALAVIFLPMLLKGPDVREPDAAEVPLSMPATPNDDYETRELPLTAPEGVAPPGGVLGMAPAVAGASDDAPAPADRPIADPSLVAPAAVLPPAPPTASAAAPVAAATVTPAQVGAGNLMVNIGTFSNLPNANALAAKLRALNLPVVADSVTLSGGTAMRLRVGPYLDRAAAEAARLRAETVTGSAGKVVALDAGKPVTTAAAPAVSAAAPAPLSKPVKPAAPAPVAAAEPVKPAALASGFAVQLSAPSVESEANALRDRARGQGFSSFVQRIETDSGVRYRVRVGPVADRAAAGTLRDAVNGKLGTQGIVVPNP